MISDNIFETLSVVNKLDIIRKKLVFLNEDHSNRVNTLDKYNETKDSFLVFESSKPLIFDNIANFLSGNKEQLIEEKAIEPLINLIDYNTINIYLSVCKKNIEQLDKSLEEFMEEEEQVDIGLFMDDELSEDEKNRISEIDKEVTEKNVMIYTFESCYEYGINIIESLEGVSLEINSKSTWKNSFDAFGSGFLADIIRNNGEKHSDNIFETINLIVNFKCFFKGIMEAVFISELKDTSVSFFHILDDKIIFSCIVNNRINDLSYRIQTYIKEISKINYFILAEKIKFEKIVGNLNEEKMNIMFKI